MMNFSYTILYVENVSTQMSFYKQAFGFTQKLLTPEEDYGELNTGATVLAFGKHELTESNLSEGYLKSSPKSKPFGIEIGITTQNVDAAIEKVIQAGGTLYEPKQTKPWGQEVAYVRDPEGFLIEICTPMG